MGIEALVPRPGTSKAAPDNEIYPYLLRGLAITRPNHVWAADITYIPMAKGFLYLVAIIDWASRAVLSGRLSNTMDASFCLAALEEALARHGKPEIFNTDQGAQFTSAAFTGKLAAAGAVDAAPLGRRKRVAHISTAKTKEKEGGLKILFEAKVKTGADPITP
jgi:putative transposase